jgi:hypothetical protein
VIKTARAKVIDTQRTSTLRVCGFGGVVSVVANPADTLPYGHNARDLNAVGKAEAMHALEKGHPIERAARAYRLAKKTGGLGAPPRPGTPQWQERNPTILRVHTIWSGSEVAS